jgi:hypothetical protein
VLGARLPRNYFTARADVLVTDDTTGRRTAKVRGDLPCRVERIASQNVGDGRDELLRRRELRWPGDYDMPLFCDVAIRTFNHRGELVSSSTWTPLQGTFGQYSTPEGDPVYKRADIVEQTDLGA